MSIQTTGMKRCRRCGVEKEIRQNFYLQKRGYCSYCRPCQAAMSAEYRSANVEVLRERRRAARAANPEHFRQKEAERYLNSDGVRLSREARNTPCVDCGIQLPAVIMEFDHVRGTKLFNIGGAGLSRRPAQEVRDEIAKCDVRCPNCHKLRHYRERETRNASQS